DAAEFPPRGIARVRRTHASANVFLRKQLQVRVKLGVQFTVKLPFAEKSAQTRAENAKPLHVHAPSVLARRRAMSAVMPSQLLVSASSCLRPARVSEYNFALRLFSEAPHLEAIHARC